MFHRKGMPEYREDTRATMASAARYEHQGQVVDTASVRPIGIVFPNDRSGDRKDSGAAISPVAALDTTAISNTTPFWVQRRRRDATAGRTC